MLLSGIYLVGTPDVNTIAELSNLDITAMVCLIVGMGGFIAEE
jgi:hypothetical protein